MTYDEALNWIHGATRIGARDGFARIERVLELAGDPHKRLKFVHVAGTNGKGSTATMTANILTRAGYKTGLFISPYVVDFRERIQLCGQLIPRDELASAVETLKPVFEQVKAEIAECTEFEVVTVIGLWWFAKMGCDFVVLECGIGGLNDKTNVIPSPEVAAIASISFDHVAILGSTLREIASQKAGIIKPGCSAALYCDLTDEALAAIMERCSEAGVVPNIPDKNAPTDVSISGEGCDFTYKGRRWHVPLIGRHQIYNALTVIAVCEELRKRGFAISDDDIAEGIAGTSFVGRCEILRREPLCIIDGAHNIDGAQSLCGVIDEVMKGRHVTVVMGMLEDKDYRESITMIASRAAKFIAVTPDSYRSLPAEKTAEIARAVCSDVIVSDKPADGAALALETAGKDDVIIACGSLYMIGEVKERILG
ncbi:MAG: bifunctional folylpolyglutamate synthase/dihydrofolate synthase [Clostridia bacterium]|nr:bifunctional folylpolyglutamate synthase/dihydrofolate synthase [Clostridia bacterium]MBQ9966286.1 bifunctional folylpolyglutamate synthase/dihydrofolate synthase [Clostridia bacterium]